MAFIQCKIRSAVLQTSVAIQLYFPTDLPAEVGNEVKGVLTLLHGYTNDCDDWVHMTSACRYAADNGLALVVPSVGNSFYLDMVHGGAYFTFITEEMPRELNRIFRLPQARESSFVAGLSMGGYGAVMAALRRPDLYAACASFSGALDLAALFNFGDHVALFGDAQQVPPNADLFQLAQQAAALPKAQQPRILLTCGKQDTSNGDIHDYNVRFAAHCKALGLATESVQWNGVHEWNFWDRSITRGIDFFLQNGYYARKLADWRAEEESI